MKLVAFIEARQADLVRKIPEHCGLWHDPPSRAPPSPCGPSQTPRQVPAPGPEAGVTYEADSEFLAHARGEKIEQPNLPWDA